MLQTPTTREVQLNIMQWQARISIREKQERGIWD